MGGSGSLTAWYDLPLDTGQADWQHRSRGCLVRHPGTLEDLYLRWGSCVVARPPVDWYHGH